MRRSPRPERTWAGRSPPFEIPGDDRARLGTCARRARGRSRNGAARFAAYKSRISGVGGRARAAHGGRSAGRLRRSDGCLYSGARRRKASRWPRASPHRRRSTRSARRCPSCSAARPISRRRTARCARIRSRLTPDAPGGNYIHFGVREFGMSAIMNGITAHGGFIPYGGTFLTFSDYARNARAHGGAHAPAGDFRLHARFDRPGRGWSDAPADRAAGRACG